MILATVVAGCGGGSDGASTTGAAPAATTTAPATTTPRPTFADRDTVRAVRDWSAALRRGRIAAAAAYFAQPSRVQNGTPPITLRTDADRVAFNDALPCGAVPIRFARSARGFVVVTFRLTERVGGDCQGAAGKTARCAIRVRRGRMTDWIRLPDAPGPQEAAPSVGGGAV